MATKTQKDPNAMSFLDHLEVLRSHLIRSSIAILVGMIAAFIGVEYLFDGIILAPLDPHFATYSWICKFTTALGGATFCDTSWSIPLKNIQFMGEFTMHMQISLIAGIIVAFPYIIWELWRFVRPGLHERERKNGGLIIFFVAGLFFLGVLFGYYILSPLSVQFFGTYSISDTFATEATPQSYVSLVTTLTLATGLIFELPVLAYFFSSIGLLTPEWMKKYRRHAIVVVLIFAAIITPPDVYSQVLVAIPVMFLYQISIVISSRVNRRRNSRTA